MTFLLAVLISLLIGLGLKFLLDVLDSDQSITWVEYAVCAVICTVIIVPATVKIGVSIVKQNKLSYNEYYSGYETAATFTTDRCSRDGSCAHHYDCDSYLYTYTVTVPDADGKGSHSEVRTEVRYHQCPYATEERDYIVRTTVDDVTVGSNYFAPHPQAWRQGHGLPRVPSEPPAVWLAAKQRLESNDPGGVTFQKTYDNYILASQRTILKRYAGSIKKYEKDRLLPRPARGVSFPYYADKAYFVGPVNNRDAWKAAVTRFNAAFGDDLHADLHLVLVTDPAVQDADDYSSSLFAYWQSPKLGKHAISKNALMVVVGIDPTGSRVRWARAATGMPVGNEALLTEIQNELPKSLPTPELLLGHPIGHVMPNGKVEVSHTTQGLEGMVWGEHKFHRVCMTCKGEKKVGYTYLSEEIKPTTGQNTVIVLCAVLMSLIVWAMAIATGIRMRGYSRAW